MAKNKFDNLFQNRIISVEQGTTMYDEHHASRTGPLQPILRDSFDKNSFVDTKFVHFSLNDLKEYISFIEHIQEENPDKDVSGVRIYFAAYPNSDRIDNKTNKHPGQQTVFMAPTVNIGQVDKTYPNMNNLPFYIKGTEENPYKGKFEIISDLMLDYKKQERLNEANTTLSQKNSSLVATNLQSTELSTSTLFNEGQLSPPPL